MENAARLGTFEILLFLHVNRSKDCTDRAAFAAATNQNLKTFQ